MNVRSRPPWSTSAIRALAMVIATTAVLALTASACSSDGDDAGSTFPLQNPAAAEVEEATGLAFPDTKSDYRSVNVGDDALYLSFAVPAADVDAFATESGLTLAEGTRLLAHPSPLWPEGDPVGGAVRSAARTSDGYESNVEVWTDASDLALVRVRITTG